MNCMHLLSYYNNWHCRTLCPELAVYASNPDICTSIASSLTKSITDQMTTFAIYYISKLAFLWGLFYHQKHIFFETPIALRLF